MLAKRIGLKLLMRLKNVDGVERLLNNMERYFKVTKQSNLYNQYMEYKDNQKVMHNISKEFMNTQGIETDTYANQGNTFYIVPTEKDTERFAKSLCKSIGEGLRAFKAKSKVGKAWVETLEEKQIKIKYKPFVGRSFRNCMGKNRSRIFVIDSVVYCSFQNDYDFEDTPEGFVELKASEFWKIVEDYEGRDNNE